MQTATDLGDELLARAYRRWHAFIIIASDHNHPRRPKGGSRNCCTYSFCDYAGDAQVTYRESRKSGAFHCPRFRSDDCRNASAWRRFCRANLLFSVRRDPRLPSAVNAGALGAARSSLAGLGLTGTLEPANISATRSCFEPAALSYTPSAVRSCNWLS